MRREPLRYSKDGFYANYDKVPKIPDVQAPEVATVPENKPEVQEAAQTTPPPKSEMPQAEPPETTAQPAAQTPANQPVLPQVQQPAHQTAPTPPAQRPAAPQCAPACQANYMMPQDCCYTPYPMPPMPTMGTMQQMPINMGMNPMYPNMSYQGQKMPVCCPLMMNMPCPLMQFGAFNKPQIRKNWGKYCPADQSAYYEYGQSGY